MRLFGGIGQLSDDRNDLHHQQFLCYTSLMTHVARTLPVNWLNTSPTPQAYWQMSSQCIYGTVRSMCTKQSHSYVIWVAEWIFIHHVARRENSEPWCHCIDCCTSLKSSCTYRQVHSMRSKVYNLLSVNMTDVEHSQATGNKKLLVFTFTLRKLFSVSFQVIADAANESE